MQPLYTLLYITLARVVDQSPTSAGPVMCQNCRAHARPKLLRASIIMIDVDISDAADRRRRAPSATSYACKAAVFFPNRCACVRHTHTVCEPPYSSASSCATGLMPNILCASSSSSSSTAACLRADLNPIGLARSTFTTREKRVRVFSSVQADDVA